MARLRAGMVELDPLLKEATLTDAEVIVVHRRHGDTPDRLAVPDFFEPQKLLNNIPY